MPTPSRRLPTALALLAVAVHVVALYWPVVTVQGPVTWTDKVVHVLLFAVPLYAVGRALAGTGRSVRPTVLLLLAHAPLSELGQGMLLPGRSADPWDAVVDVLGVALGAGALALRSRVEARRGEAGPVVGEARARW
ncbi:MAG TPA: VanZ family protein [Intrasporangium sp.]|uniref:VanZ family protein n=1 Tax=Intrasporangium sp. TaxID=1925024 RepID=UPI002D78A4AB|nr:VanZ family protein [Intrasporangium sp.]HET7397769.1 VanZ family protein [Intrasporangium sp.]